METIAIMSATSVSSAMAGGASVGAALGTSGASALSTASLLSSIGTFASIGMTGFSMLSSVQSGYEQQAVYEGYAKQSELNARMETLKGREKALLIRRNLERDLASQNAIFAARGFGDGGTVDAITGYTKTTASEDIDAAMFGANYNAVTERLQANQYRSMGSSAVSSGYMKAFNTLTGSRSATSLFSRL